MTFLWSQFLNITAVCKRGWLPPKYSITEPVIRHIRAHGSNSLFPHSSDRPDKRRHLMGARKDSCNAIPYPIYWKEGLSVPVLATPRTDAGWSGCRCHVLKVVDPMLFLFLNVIKSVTTEEAWYLLSLRAFCPVVHEGNPFSIGLYRIYYRTFYIMHMVSPVCQDSSTPQGQSIRFLP